MCIYGCTVHSFSFCFTWLCNDLATAMKDFYYSPPLWCSTLSWLQSAWFAFFFFSKLPLIWEMSARVDWCTTEWVSFCRLFVIPHQVYLAACLHLGLCYEFQVNLAFRGMSLNKHSRRISCITQKKGGKLRSTSAVKQAYHFQYKQSSVIKMLLSAKLPIRGIAADINQMGKKFHLLF